MFILVGPFTRRRNQKRSQPTQRLATIPKRQLAAADNAESIAAEEAKCKKK
jgi:hypothetical protein